MSNPSKIRSKPYRNWVRGALGLYYLQRGLYPFTDRVVKAEHAKLVQNLTPCTTCSIEHILPAHASGKVCIQKNRAKCNCRKYKNTNCATCSKIYDDIVLHHRFIEPQWVTDCSTWYNDHWQFAKCFLTTTSKGINNTAAETDASGLLSIIINGLFFQSDIQCNIDPPNDSLSQVREIRNEILHNSTLDLTDNDVARYLQSMIAVLEDKKALSLDPAAQAAARKLKEILNDELNITTHEEAYVIKLALDAIKTAKEHSEESIRKLAEEKQNAIRASEESIRKLTDEKQIAIKASEESIKKLTEEKQTAINASEENIRKLTDENQIAMKSSEESIRKLAEENQNAIKASEARMKTLTEEKQSAIRASEESIRKLTDEKQIAIKASEESIKKLTEEKQTAINASEENIRKLTDENQIAMKSSEESIRKLAEENQNAIKASENNIKGIAKESQTALQQQTSEAAQKIKSVEEKAIEHVTSTVTKVFKQTYEQQINKLNLGHGDHEKRIKAVAAEQQNLQMKQNELVKQVDKLTNTEKKHQARMNYLKQKQDLQQYLVKSYQRQHVKTWISPLMTQHNDVNIGDVYVSPRMVVEENKDGKDGNTSEVENGTETSNRHIKRYRDLFSTHGKRNRNIFILGDVGTGKSSFCKMMVQNWCTAILKRGCSDDSSAMEEEDAKTNKENNTCDMNDFDYLFYIPLREMSGHFDDTVDMIKAQLEDYKLLIDEIFTNDSERILILADGLDEWTPPGLKRPPSLQHVAVGIPTSRSVRDSTLITTSRPSSRGVLNMKSSEYDLKVTLLGLDYTSVTPMIENYMKILSEPSAVLDFKTKLLNLKLKDLQNAPLLLQQIIWLYCNNYNIAQSRSFIYLNIVNIILGWEHERVGGDLKLHEFQNRDLEHLPLPKCFDGFARCQENRKLLLLLGRLAYDAYVTSSDSSLVFGRLKLKQLGVSDDDISFILRTGFLTEIHSADPTHEKSQLSFIHTSYLEFFATLYMCSYYLSKVADTHSSETSLHILGGLIAVNQDPSTAKILRLENVLIMMCGLVPCLTEHIYEYIYKISKGDSCDIFVISHAAKLMFDCLSEHNSNHDEAVNLRHLHSVYGTDEEMIDMLSSYIVPASIETCTIEYNRFFCQSHGHFTKLSSVLSQAVLLRALKIYGVECSKHEPDGHNIDLTNNRKLQSIELSKSKISISGINHTCLESCKISNCKLTHEQYSLLSSCLSKAVSLQTLEIDNIRCTKDECEGHVFDLTNHKKLQILKIKGRNNYFGCTISVSGINPTCLESCKISNCKLTHEQYSLLSSCLSKAVSLQTLEIDNIRCTEDECGGHVFDLTNHRKLQSLEFSGCANLCNSKICRNLLYSGINPTCLKSCKISQCMFTHEQCKSLALCLSQATSLHSLQLFELGCNDCEMGCTCCHAVDLTNHSQLNKLNIWNCNIIFFTGINPTCLKECDISNRNLSHEQCKSLCTSLSHAYSLSTLNLCEIKCIEDTCEGHAVNLTNHKQLRFLSLSNCNMLSITGIHPASPISTCNIKNCNLSHEQCISLCTSLSHAESLYFLTLSDIKCIEDTCAGHTVNLTNHKQLSRLSISNCNMISITGIHPTCPIRRTCNIKNCTLSHDQCISLCSSLTHAESLYDLTLSDIKCIEDTCAGHTVNLTNHKQLSRLSISNCNMISITCINLTCLNLCDISNGYLSHAQCTSLCTFLTHAEFIVRLTLSDIKCTEDGCAGHIIDLTRHKQLHNLSTSNCNMISITGINPACLNICDISNRNLSHGQCTSLCTSLTLAESLHVLALHNIKCIEDSCAGHTVNLTNHKQLSYLSVSNCNMISITGVNPTCPRLTCYIEKCNLSHDQCISLCTSLTHTESLYGLTLRDIKCVEGACAGHVVNLNNHTQLQNLSISICNMISVTGTIPACLKRCDISNCNLSHEQCTSLCAFLTDAESLDDLTLSHIKCIEDSCAGHVVNLNNHTQLQNLSISSCNMISFTGINHTCLKECYIKNCYLSHEQCTSLCTSLTHADSLYRLTLRDIKCSEATCAGHIIDLTNHKRLYSLYISNCNTISITGINPDCPMSRWFINGRFLTHEQGGSSCTLL